MRPSASSGLISSSRSQGLSPSSSSAMGKHLDPIQESHQQTAIGAKLSVLSALKKPMEKEGKLSGGTTSGQAPSNTSATPVTVATAKVSKTASASLPTNGGNQALKTGITKPVRRESIGGTGLSQVVGGTQLPPNTNNNNSHAYSRSRPQTPSSRERSLNAKNQQQSQDGLKSNLPSEHLNESDALPQHNHEIGVIGSSGDKKVRPKSFWGGWWRF